MPLKGVLARSALFMGPPLPVMLGLRAFAGQMRRQVERERLARRVVLQRNVDVVIDGARLVLLIVGDGDLAVGDLQLARG